MTETVDHSDRLAYESFLLTHLNDLDPDGAWTANELYQRRRQRRYGGLSVGEMDALLDFLEQVIETLPKEAYQSWLLTRHQQTLEDDATTQKTLVPGMD
jgi:hypothetical protein